MNEIQVNDPIEDNQGLEPEQIECDAIAEEFFSLCRNTGFRATKLRLALYRYLDHNTDHPGIDDALKGVRTYIPNVSRESVYRALTDFANLGLISVLNPPDTVTRYDANPKRHDHFYCESCGKFFDFEIKEIPSLVEAAAHDVGKITFTEVRLRGVCNDCLEKQKKESLSVFKGHCWPSR